MKNLGEGHCLSGVKALKKETLRDFAMLERIWQVKLQCDGEDGAS